MSSSINNRSRLNTDSFGVPRGSISAQKNINPGCLLLPAPQFTYSFIHINFIPKFEAIQVAPSKQRSLKDGVEFEAAFNMSVYIHLRSYLRYFTLEHFHPEIYAAATFCLYR
jgi:hypothetical protein